MGGAKLLSPTSMTPMEDSPIFSIPKSEVNIIQRQTHETLPLDPRKQPLEGGFEVEFVDSPKELQTDNNNIIMVYLCVFTGHSSCTSMK